MCSESSVSNIYTRKERVCATKPTALMQYMVLVLAYTVEGHSKGYTVLYPTQMACDSFRLLA